MRRVVRGFWGLRPEPVQRLTERWHLTLDRLAGLLPAAGDGTGRPWTWRVVAASGPGEDLTADEPSLLSALRRAQSAEDWSDRTGTGLRLVRQTDAGWKIEVSGLAGGAPEFLLQSMVITVVSPGAEVPPDAELLAAVAELWDPDFGDVTDDDVMDALEDDAEWTVGDPSVGWLAYLSPARAALLPDDFTGVRKEMQGGGLLLDIAAPDDPEAVVASYVRLREAGALQPLPRPLDRATL
ncbi:hypothetical protein AB0H97_14095 [Streptomyces sp. NPDC050788]|uniref:hypothetical protein n=1 Tax=Streptomyces sp. NPDC050788 TaxID=3155041 RepID=UPI003424AA6F